MNIFFIISLLWTVSSVGEAVSAKGGSSLFQHHLFSSHRAPSFILSYATHYKDSAQRSFTTIPSWLDTESYDDLLSGPKSLLMESCRHFVGQQFGKTNEDRNNALQRLLATRQKKSVAISRIPTVPQGNSIPANHVVPSQQETIKNKNTKGFLNANEETTPKLPAKQSAISRLYQGGKRIALKTQNFFRNIINKRKKKTSQESSQGLELKERTSQSKNEPATVVKPVSKNVKGPWLKRFVNRASAPLKKLLTRQRKADERKNVEVGSDKEAAGPSGTKLTGRPTDYKTSDISSLPKSKNSRLKKIYKKMSAPFKLLSRKKKPTATGDIELKELNNLQDVTKPSDAVTMDLAKDHKTADRSSLPKAKNSHLKKVYQKISAPFRLFSRKNKPTATDVSELKDPNNLQGVTEPSDAVTMDPAKEHKTADRFSLAKLKNSQLKKLYQKISAPFILFSRKKKPILTDDKQLKDFSRSSERVEKQIPTQKNKLASVSYHVPSSTVKILREQEKDKINEDQTSDLNEKQFLVKPKQLEIVEPEGVTVNRITELAGPKYTTEEIVKTKPDSRRSSVYSSKFDSDDNDFGYDEGDLWSIPLIGDTVAPKNLEEQELENAALETNSDTNVSTDPDGWGFLDEQLQKSKLFSAPSEAQETKLPTDSAVEDEVEDSNFAKILSKKGTDMYTLFGGDDLFRNAYDNDEKASDVAQQYPPSHPELDFAVEQVQRQTLVDDKKDAEEHDSLLEVPIVETRSSPASKVEGRLIDSVEQKPKIPPQTSPQLNPNPVATSEVKQGSSQLTSTKTGQAQQKEQEKPTTLDKSSEVKKKKFEADQSDFVEFKIKLKNEVSEMTLDDWFKTVQSKTPDLFVILTFDSSDRVNPVEILLDSATVKQRVQAFDNSQRNVLLKQVVNSLDVERGGFDEYHIKAMCNFAYRCIEGKKLALSALRVERPLFSQNGKRNIFKCTVTLKSTVAQRPEARALWEQLKNLPPLYPTLDEQHKPLALVYGNTAASHDIYVFFHNPPDRLRPFNINPVKLADPVDNVVAVCNDALKHIYVANNAHVSFGSLSETDKKTYNQHAVKMDFQDFKLQDTSIPLSLHTYAYDKKKLCVFSPKKGVFDRVSKKVLRFVSILADTRLHWKSNAPKVKPTASFANV